MVEAHGYTEQELAEVLHHLVAGRTEAVMPVSCWCGEGDLVLQALLKTRKLFISHLVTNGKTTENAYLGPNLVPGWPEVGRAHEIPGHR